MFDFLSDKFDGIFKKLRNRGKLKDADIDFALSEVRDALLEADVHFQTAKEFCARLRDKCKGEGVVGSLNPGQTVVKFVHEELIEAMGAIEGLNLKHAPPVVVMLVGLQGSGKTTSCGKLASYIKDTLRRRPMLVSADIYRPAAIDQLSKLASELGIEFFKAEEGLDALSIANGALDYARKRAFDTVILDTAGRLQIDSKLMNELADIVESIDPHEILLVVDAMTGQEALNVAKGFDRQLDIDGMILTKLDGDARGGAALSMRVATSKPIKFLGVGERLDALEVFRPERLASRILGMGDLLTLIEKASRRVDEEEADRLKKRLKKNRFSLDDLYKQMQMFKSMGSISSMARMIPGANKVARQIDEEQASKEIARMEAIILSMTPAERADAALINGSRRKRIAMGSGTSVEAVNRLLRQHKQMSKMMKKLTKMGPAALKGMGAIGAAMQRGLPNSLK